MPTTEAEPTTTEQEVDPSLTIVQRLAAILAEMPAIGKDAYNEQQRFHYRAHDDVMNALNPLLGKYAVVFVPDVIERTTDQRATRSGGVMYEVNLHVRFTFYGPDGDSVSGSAWGEGTDSGDKATNKAMTGALKNMLAQTFALSTAELSDADGETPEPTTGRATAAGRGQEPRPGRTRTAPAAPRPFDPGIDLAEGAISGEGFMERISEALDTIDATVDWRGVLNTLGGEMGGGADGWRGLTDEGRAEFWRRVANALTKLDLASFPPPSDEAVIEAFAWAFNGRRIVLDRSAAEAAAAADGDTPVAADMPAADDIPFGEQQP